ncbi:DUF6221 family protein [Streptomyces sp. NPDC058231]|uniref:DUF6221 family protein n=1 Tax=Streptomyces sp. NPDC058231 TaxID=3346392 RepID=UPI0036E6403C
MDDLVTFLLARLDEDEQAALDASWDGYDSGRWTAHHHEQHDGQWVVIDCHDKAVTGVDAQVANDAAVAHHIARHDPARVLQEIGARRVILVEYATMCRLRDEAVARIEAAGDAPAAEDLDAWERTQQEVSVLEGPVRLLALTHGDHPDYREDWRP